MVATPEAVNYVEVAGAGLLALSIFVSALMVGQQNAVGRAQMRLDCLMHCNLRYDEIYEQRIDIQKAISESGRKFSWKNKIDGTQSKLDSDIHSYFNRYWGLQADQFDYWIYGKVDTDSLCSWWFNIVGSCHAKESIFPGIGIAESWEKFGRPQYEFAAPWFREFVDKMIEISEDDPRNVSTRTSMMNFFEDIEPRILNFSRLNSGRMKVKTFRRNRNKKLLDPVSWVEKLALR